MSAHDSGTPKSAPTEAGERVVLDIVGLHKHFVLHNIGGRRVEGLNGVDLQVRPGEHVALAGSSGAGKSSLLKCVYRTYRPTAGRVLLSTRADDGGPWAPEPSSPTSAAGPSTPANRTVDLVALADHQLAAVRNRDVGYVSQFLRAEPRRSAFDLVRRAAVVRGMGAGEAAEAAAAALQRLYLDESLWSVSAAVLSGGEKQRVNLAAGTIAPPALLLLDEPVSALDPRNRDAALELIADLTAQGVAVLAVFHDLDAMRRLASRVVLMNGGRVELDGSPDVVLDHLTGVAR